MNLKKNILKEEEEIKGIFIRILKRDFSGNSGIAIKNSVYSFATNLVAKFGSLIFTIIIARLLLPDLFGLYSLALSTIMIFLVFANLGIGQTIVKFIASSKSNKKSKAYFQYLSRIRLILTLISMSILFLLAKVIAHNYYHKPIFLALIAGSLYIFFSTLISLFDALFQANNNFKKSFYRESIFQIFRLILVPITILLFLNKFSEEILLFFVFLAISISFFMAFIFIFVSAKREISFLKLKSNNLNKKEKKKLNKFIIALSAMSISGVLFGSIDVIILGRFVEANFIGYYRVAFSLITSAAPLITFSGALFPLFSQLKGKQLKRGFNRTLRLTVFISFPVFLFTLIFAPLVVRIIFGQEYFLSGNILRLFSILILILPFIAIYSSFLISQSKTNIVTRSLVISTAINVILNYILIISLLPYGQFQAVYGATLATIISNFLYLGMLVRKN